MNNFRNFEASNYQKTWSDQNINVFLMNIFFIL